MPVVTCSQCGAEIIVKNLREMRRAKLTAPGKPDTWAIWSKGVEVHRCTPDSPTTLPRPD